MIAKIARGASLYGALAYNYQKVEKENAHILFTQKIIEAPDGSYSMEQLSRSFDLHLLANRKTEKPILHISLNPDPKDTVNDTDFENMAQEYMKQMGYGEQPFAVFKHTDIDRTHIHIVSVCVDGDGRKISDKFEKRHSMAVCRTLEKEYGLISAVDKEKNSQNQTFSPVDYKAGDVKSQMASVIRHLPKYYQFQTFGAYNALLSLFKITAEEIKGEYNGIPKQGLVYFALNDKGEKASNPFKASLFGKGAGLVQLQSHYEQSRTKLKGSPAKESAKGRIESAMQGTPNESEFKNKLLEQGINVVVRRNAQGRIYGITFIDHQSRCVCNGSELGKNLSANVFNDWWNNGNKADLSKKENTVSQEIAPAGNQISEPYSQSDFSGKEDMPENGQENNIIEAFGSLLPENQGEDFQETAFANQMKRKDKRRKPKL
ncbi:relaxase [Flavobacterium cupreum]|uniref:Relaxase/mobilization nuclease domain-containing protein n=2 Tax=Flavobacterium TaxID=237 RepID=A0A940XCH7_9FLAO|nr:MULTISPECIES: conjugal transfer protein MobB [Flavobacterium]MBP4140137.1 relaxase/mobilization nuclease domain-containing protein [Flavobacterium geliluteum]RUT67805.1 relaxase [Flavobacterium cupreum]